MRFTRVALKRLVSEPVRNGVGEQSDPGQEGWPRYIRTTDIAGPRSLRSDTWASLPPEVAMKARVAPGDILLTAAGNTIGTSVLVDSSVPPACFAGYLVLARTGPNCDPSFLSYWTESLDFRDQVWSGMVKSTIPNFSASRYARMKVPEPGMATQHLIAEFLDRETERIDAVVAAKRRMIELLDEERTALIAHTVTKGLDPTVPMKDSGIPWLGEVPEHWRRGALKRGLSSNDSGTWGDDPKGGARDRPVVRSTEISLDGRWRLASVASRHLSDREARRATLVRDDLVMVTSSGSQDHIGKTALVDDEVAPLGAGFSNFVQRLRVSADLLHPRFAFYWLNSTAAREQLFFGSSTSTGLRNLTASSIEGIVVTYPPTDQQEAIVRRLDDLLDRMGAVVQALRVQLTLLAEYRQALITAAVTGRLSESVLKGEVPIEEAVEVSA